MLELALQLATKSDAAELAAMRTAVAEDLTARFGHGHWSSASSEKGVLFGMTRGQVFIGRQGGRIAVTLTLARTKPWAIDQSCFTPVKAPLYLIAMAVAVDQQRTGLGRAAMTEAERIARASRAQAIRLDAYDTPAGAGVFYAECGYVEMGRAEYRGTPLIYYERML